LNPIIDFISFLCKFPCCEKSTEFLYHSGQSWLCFRVYRNGYGPLSSVTSRVLRRLAARCFVGGIGLLFSAFLCAVSHALGSSLSSCWSLVLHIIADLSVLVPSKRRTIIIISEWKWFKFKIKRFKFKTNSLFYEIFI